MDSYIAPNNSKGTAAISFAILAPIFVLVLIGVIQLGIMMIIQNALEAGARQASRYGIVKTPDSSNSRLTAINNKVKSVIATYSGGIVNQSKIVITTTAYNSFSNTSSGTVNSVGTGNQAVLYNISYVYDTLYPMFSLTSTSVTLKASALVVNENYT